MGSRLPSVLSTNRRGEYNTYTSWFPDWFGLPEWEIKKIWNRFVPGECGAVPAAARRDHKLENLIIGTKAAKNTAPASRYVNMWWIFTTRIYRYTDTESVTCPFHCNMVEETFLFLFFPLGLDAFVTDRDFGSPRREEDRFRKPTRTTGDMQ